MQFKYIVAFFSIEGSTAHTLEMVCRPLCNPRLRCPPLRNCINFADELCYLLGVGSIPRWLFALQEHATSLQQHVQSATGGIAAAAQRIQSIDHKAGFTATAAAAAASAAAAARSFGGFIKQANEVNISPKQAWLSFCQSATLHRVSTLRILCPK